MPLVKSPELLDTTLDNSGVFDCAPLAAKAFNLYETKARRGVGREPEGEGGGEFIVIAMDRCGEQPNR